jgi:type IV secretory pathway VirB2 component (pilin)
VSFVIKQPATPAYEERVSMAQTRSWEGAAMAVMVHTDPPLALSAHSRRRRHLWRRALVLALAAIVLVPVSSYAQASPWEAAVNALMTSFTGPIARGLSLVSIVVGGITFAFGEGGSKRLLAGILFGVGMALSAVNFMAWLFPQ